MYTTTYMPYPVSSNYWMPFGGSTGCCKQRVASARGCCGQNYF